MKIVVVVVVVVVVDLKVVVVVVVVVVVASSATICRLSTNWRRNVERSRGRDWSRIDEDPGRAAWDHSRNCRESKLGSMRDRLPPWVVVVVGVEVAVAVGVGVAPPG